MLQWKLLSADSPDTRELGLWHHLSTLRGVRPLANIRLCQKIQMSDWWGSIGNAYERKILFLFASVLIVDITMGTSTGHMTQYELKEQSNVRKFTISVEDTTANLWLGNKTQLKIQNFKVLILRSM